MSELHSRYDVIIQGGGFYGVCLALYFRSVAKKVVIFETRDDILTQASYNNQARIHTGFHYPRSFVTARRSLALYRRFIADFPEAVVDDFQMLYAIARFGSKITHQRFEKMFRDLEAPIQPASASEIALFDPNMISAVFRCDEVAFNATVLRKLLWQRLRNAGVKVFTDAEVTRVDPVSGSNQINVVVKGLGPISSPIVVDATYGQFDGGRSTDVTLKYEQAEIALIQPPAALDGYGVTVMDGPFFSTMPFPAEGAYSLTHVRHTPHQVWFTGEKPPRRLEDTKSHWLHMVRDSTQFMPCLDQCKWLGSLYETKTVLLRNESDDGRPILLHRSPTHRGIIKVLGGKLDNIYDLFDALSAEQVMRGAHAGLLAPVSQGLAKA